MGERADRFTVGQHFTGKSPRVREVYDRLLALLEKIGPVREDPKKTSIHVVRISGGRYHHQFKMSSPNELDGEIRRWLKDAWELSG